jgi:hypothetical protein
MTTGLAVTTDGYSTTWQTPRSAEADFWATVQQDPDRFAYLHDGALPVRPPIPEEEARAEDRARRQAADREAIEAAARETAESVAASAASVADVQEAEPKPVELAEVAEVAPEVPDPDTSRFDALHDAQDAAEAVPDGTQVIPAAGTHTEIIDAVPAAPAPRKPRARKS